MRCSPSVSKVLGHPFEGSLSLGTDRGPYKGIIFKGFKQKAAGQCGRLELYRRERDK
jgi:hypothetical protein